MINPGYKISVNDIKEFKTFKKSEAYGSYLKSIAQSPAFIALMDEHINNVDITDDINLLKNSGEIPDSVTAKNISYLFKTSLGRMAICILADSIILKELEDCKVESILSGLKKDSDILYLLGKAEKKYYTQAAKLAEDGKLSDDSLVFRGLMAYIKLNGKDFKEPQDTCSTLVNTKTPIEVQSETASSTTQRKRKIKSINTDSDTIIL